MANGRSLNGMADKLRRGEVVRFVVCMIANGYSAELVASLGFDAIQIDLQHSELTYDTLTQLLRAIRSHQVPVMVRASNNNASEIARILDAGVYNVVCPMVSSREECEQFVDACYYSPVGSRSWGPMSAISGSTLTGPEYFRIANDSVLPIVMIETAAGLEAVEDILSVKGVGGVYVGASDLSIELGLGCIPDIKQKKFTDALEKIIGTARKYGVPAGAYLPTLEGARLLRSMGGQMLWVGADHLFIRQAAARVLEEIRGGALDLPA
jgi:2-keto-3-deoxy-L-rhamnonate aldolase RhmA